MLLAFLLSTLTAMAEGKLSGSVTDAITGEPVMNAIVMVKGSTIGTVTDMDGHFSLNLPAGLYQLQVRYMGYDTINSEQILVSENQSSTIRLRMSNAGAKELKEVSVRSKRKQESINALYAAQKASMSIQDGISSDIIRRSPDRNTGEVLRRVSGTTVQENKFIVVRGLNERYNATLMNAAVLPSTEPDKKAFSFELIPANLIDNITIFKTATPELPGDFAGGAIRIATKDFPEHKKLELSLGLGMNAATTADVFYRGVHQGRFDALGILDDSRWLPAAFPGKKEYLNLSSSEQVAITRSFSNHFGYEKASSGIPNLSGQLTAGNTFRLGRMNDRRLGFLFSLGYQSGRRYQEGFRDEFDISKTRLYHVNNRNYTIQRNLGSILNLSYASGPSRISFRNFFNNDFEHRLILREGRNEERASEAPLFIRSYGEEVIQNQLFSSSLEGRHELGSNQARQLEWNASYSRVARHLPDQKIITLVSDPSDGTDDHPYYVKLNNINSPAIKDAGRLFSSLHEDIYSAGIRYASPYRTGSLFKKLKAGIEASFRSRGVAVTALGYASTKFSGQTLYATGDQPWNSIFSNSQMQQYIPQILLANILTNSIDYSGTARLGAAYLMSENELTKRLKMVFGLRAESFRQQLIVAGAANEKSNLDLLPSVNLSYDLNAKSKLRLSGFRAVNRPEFREFAPYRYYDYANDFIVAGNPNLERSSILNADLRYELFPAAGEIFSASAFYKHFSNPIEQINLGNSVLSYENVPGAVIYGVEAELRKNLGFLAASRLLENLGLYLNAAYIKGSVEVPGKGRSASLMQGQSPYILNGGLSYQSKQQGLSFHLLYNRSGERIQFRGQGFADIWERSRNILDFQIAKQLWADKGELKMGWSNLLNSPQEFYYKYGGGTAFQEQEDRKISSLLSGRSCSVSFRYRF